jgi:hypothetical protein
MSPEKRERLEAIIAANLGIEGFTFADFIANPGDFGGTVNDAELLKFYIQEDRDDDAFTNLFSNVSGPSVDSSVPGIVQNEDGSWTIGSGLQTTGNVRKVVVKDDAGKPIIGEDGNPKTIDIDLEKGIFPAENFVETFIQTLKQSDISKIQSAAINMGYIDEEDLGSEVNGNMGIVTENFIYQVLDYANQEYQDWYEGSPARTSFVQNEEQARNEGAIAYEINKFFGGLDYRSNQLNKEQILSREIFSNAMDAFLTVRKSESDAADYKMDKAKAAEIRAKNIKPNQLDLEEQLDEYWTAITGDKLSDSRKEELALGVMRKWTPYVDALIAQDKSLRAGEVMNYFTGPTISTMPEEMTRDGQYVMFEDIKPEFKVEDPRQKAFDELEQQAESQSELSNTAKTIADTQAEYLKWMMGRK